MNDESHGSNGPRRSGRARGIGWALGIAVVAAIVVIAVFVNRPDGGQSPSSRDASAASSTTETTQASETPEAPEKPEAPDPFPQLKAIDPHESAQVDDLEVRIEKIEHVTGEPVGAGEVEGPAIRLTVTIANEGKEPLDLGLVVVNAFYGESQAPANTFQRPGGVPFGGTLEAGKTAEGVVLFDVPDGERDDVAVWVDYRPGQPAVVFRGTF